MLKALTQYFHITAQVIASYLQCSLAFVQSIAAARRVPGPAQLEKLLTLHNALQLATAVEQLPYAQQLAAQQQPQVANQLQAHIGKLQETLAHQQQKLTSLRTKRNKLLRGYHACCYLLAQSGMAEHQRQWVQLRQAHLTQKLHELHPSAIKKIEAKIAGLQAELSFLESA